MTVDRLTTLLGILVHIDTAMRTEYVVSAGKLLVTFRTVVDRLLVARTPSLPQYV